jgi:hypothetical protein
MKRVVNIANNFNEAEKWDILQNIKMKPEQRQKIAKILKQRFYGKNPLDVREYYKKLNEK